MSHLAGTMVAVRYHSTNKTVYSAKYHLIGARRIAAECLSAASTSG